MQLSLVITLIYPTDHEKLNLRFGGQKTDPRYDPKLGAEHRKPTDVWDASATTTPTAIRVSTQGVPSWTRWYCSHAIDCSHEIDTQNVWDFMFKPVFETKKCFGTKIRSVNARVRFKFRVIWLNYWRAFFLSHSRFFNLDYILLFIHFYISRTNF